MSNKKQFVGKPAADQGTVIPPRYQPPPIPNGQGILKHPPKDVKYPPQKPGEAVKVIYPNDQAKPGFYPTQGKEAFPYLEPYVFNIILIDLGIHNN